MEHSDNRIGGATGNFGPGLRFAQSGLLAAEFNAMAGFARPIA
jgi:hypothetical protein